MGREFPGGCLRGFVRCRCVSCSYWLYRRYFPRDPGAEHVLVFWRTYEKVEADMSAALAAGQRAVANAADELDGMGQRSWRLCRRTASPVRTATRNVRATLQRADDSLLHSILPPPAHSVPPFLFNLLAGPPHVATVDLPASPEKRRRAAA